MVRNVQILDQYTKKWNLLIKRLRLVSTLPLLSKVNERVTYKQVSNYFEHFFNEIQCEFRKVHGAQHA